MTLGAEWGILSVVIKGVNMIQSFTVKYDGIGCYKFVADVDNATEWWEKSSVSYTVEGSIQNCCSALMFAGWLEVLATDIRKKFHGNLKRGEGGSAE